MNAQAATLRGPLDSTLEVIATGQREASLIFNPSPEVDSLAEHIARLDRHGVPGEVIRNLLAQLRDVLNLNAVQDRHARGAAGALDALSSLATDALTTKSITRTLREPLDLLGRADTVSAAEWQRASGEVRRVIDACGPERLRAPSLRHEMGGRRHDVLLAVLADGAAA